MVLEISAQRGMRIEPRGSTANRRVVAPAPQAANEDGRSISRSLWPDMGKHQDAVLAIRRSGEKFAQGRSGMVRIIGQPIGTLGGAGWRDPGLDGERVIRGRIRRGGVVSAQVGQRWTRWRRDQQLRERTIPCLARKSWCALNRAVVIRGCLAAGEQRATARPQSDQPGPGEQGGLVIEARDRQAKIGQGRRHEGGPQGSGRPGCKSLDGRVVGPSGPVTRKRSLRRRVHARKKSRPRMSVATRPKLLERPGAGRATVVSEARAAGLTNEPRRCQIDVSPRRFRAAMTEGAAFLLTGRFPVAR